MKRALTIVTISFSTTLFACGQNKSNNTTSDLSATERFRKPGETITATKDQLERRAKSGEFCKSKNIPVYKNLNSLFVDPEDKVTIRTQDQVVDRANALCYLELKSEKADKEMLADFDKKYISAKLTANKRQFALADYPTQQQMTDANLRAEGYYVLLWALGYIDNLKYPNDVSNVADDVKYLFSKTEKEFRSNAQLRTKSEILDQTDLILRLHWACVNSRVTNEPVPGGLDKSVVYERHYSLNRLIKLMDQEWDKVTTDT